TAAVQHQRMAEHDELGSLGGRYFGDRLRVLLVVRALQRGVRRRHLPARVGDRDSYPAGTEVDAERARHPQRNSSSAAARASFSASARPLTFFPPPVATSSRPPAPPPMAFAACAIKAAALTPDAAVALSTAATIPARPSTDEPSTTAAGAPIASR